MKNIIPILCLLIWIPSVQASIVNNSTSLPTSEDSLSLSFFSLDSLGNPTTADSVYILVTDPVGSIAYKDSMNISDSRITSTIIRSKQFYTFSEQISNIDGSGSEGIYSLALIAKKNTGDLLTPYNYKFQVVSTELSAQLSLIGDSVIVKGGLIDSNKTYQGINDSTSIANWIWNTPQSGHNSSGTFGKYLNTEVSGVSGSDSTSIANWVWNTPQSNHTNSGTFGKYLDTEISGISGGSGTFSISIVAYDTSSSQTVAGTNIIIRSITQSSLIAVGQTDSNGKTNFNLDADSFIVIAAAPGYVFSSYDTMVVTGAGIDTSLGYQFELDPPSSPNVCRVWGYLYNFQGIPEVGVTVAAFMPKGVVKYSGIIISPFAIATVTNSFGMFYLDLIPSEKLNPSDSKYEISIRHTDGTILRQRLQVPDQSVWQLTW